MTEALGFEQIPFTPAQLRFGLLRFVNIRK